MKVSELFESKKNKKPKMVKEHPYSVKLLSIGKGRWPAIKGEIYEDDVMIGRFSRGAVRDHYIPPIEYKFLSTQAKNRFDDFADSLSIEETIEALLPAKAFSSVTEDLIVEGAEKELGTLQITPEDDGFIVRCTAKSGPMLQGIYWVWKEIGKKKGVKTFLLVASRFGKAKRSEMDKASGMDIINKRPSRIEFTGVSKEDLQAAVDKAIAKVEKDMKSQAKYKADAPKRKAAAAKYQAEKRKTDMADYAAKYGKGTWGRVTYKQEGGDDGYAYVLRVDGRAKYNGLTQREAMHYKEREVGALAKAGKLGKYAETK